VKEDRGKNQHRTRRRCCGVFFVLSRYGNTVHYSMMHGCMDASPLAERQCESFKKQGISQNSARFLRTTNGIGRDAYFIAGLIADLLNRTL
jgi:hypothetical protein